MTMRIRAPACLIDSAHVRSASQVGHNRHRKATNRVSGDFLRHPVAAVPYKVHTMLIDNGIHFTTPGAGGSAVPDSRAHVFELACAQLDIEHRLTRPKHPWTNKLGRRMDRTM